MCRKRTAPRVSRGQLEQRWQRRGVLCEWQQSALELNAKTTINKVRNGISFVGLQIHVNWRKMNRKPLKKMKARIRFIEKQYAEGLIDLEAVQNTMASYYGMMSHCNSYGLRRWIERNITFQRQDKEETR